VTPSRRRLVFASLVAAAVGCGGRTGLFVLGASPGGDDGGSETGVGVGVEAGDGPARTDGPLDGGDEAIAPDIDARGDVHITPGAVSCGHATGVQQGSPWPIARRCPARAANTTAVGASAPAVAWTAQAQDWASDPVIAADGTLYLVDTVRGIVALSPGGATKWVSAYSVSYGASASLAIAADGTLLVYDGTLAGIRPADGSLAWSSRVTSYPLDFGLTVGTDGTVYVVDSPPNDTAEYAGHLYAVDGAGNVKWRTRLGPLQYPVSSPTVGASGAIYAVTQKLNGPDNQGSLVAATAGGQLAWSATIPLTPGGVSGDRLPAVGGDGTVYVPISNGVIAFSADGTELWQANLGSTPGALAISTGGTVYAMTESNLFAIGPGGTIAWSKPSSLGTGSPTGSVFVAGDGTIYVPISSGPGLGTSALDPSGNVLWTLASVGAPAVMGADGTVYSEGPDYYYAGSYSTLSALH
jgi:hypothetical protein